MHSSSAAAFMARKQLPPTAPATAHARYERLRHTPHPKLDPVLCTAEFKTVRAI
jgi:hypothetical protein